MAEKEEGDIAEIDALLATLSGNSSSEDDSEYPLPENKPVKYTGVDVVILPKGYKSEYPKPGEGKDSKPRFTDSLPSIKLDVEHAEETDGILSVPVIVANSNHVYDYDGLKVHKPFDELEAAAVFADGIPVTREHPSAGIVTDRGEVLGFFKSPLAKDNLLKGILAIADKDLIADIKDKKVTEVSPGFFCDLDRSLSGDLEGEHYDATQRNIFLNHVAVVENGRCSIEDGCGIGLDTKKFPVPSELVDKIKAAIERAKAMKDKSLLNMLKELLRGVTVKKDSEGKGFTIPDAKAFDLVKVKDAMKKIVDERNSLRDKLTEIVKAEKDSLIAELEAMQDVKKKEDLEKLALDDLKKELDMVKALKAKRLTITNTPSTGRKGIDDAYGKIGGI